MSDNDCSKTAMKIKKLVVLVFFPLLFVSFLHSQSVVELAKKEKERREALKGKAAHVVTNVDLLRVKKRPAVEIVDPNVLLDETVVEGEDVSPAVVGDETAAAETGAAETAAVATPEPQIIPPPEQPTMSETEFRTRMADCKTKVDQAQEMVDLLTLKMNGLWQEFYSLDDMKSRELIQLQISETYDKLTRAQMDTTKAQQELDDFLANARREGVPSIWIR